MAVGSAVTPVSDTTSTSYRLVPTTNRCSSIWRMAYGQLRAARSVPRPSEWREVMVTAGSPQPHLARRISFGEYAPMLKMRSRPW